VVPEVRVWNLRLESYHGGLIWRFMMAVFGVSDSIDLVVVLNMPITQLS
jgi:hypothetical protein